nr:TetR family transcriptional regulator [Paenibacillus phyllosphaerae]
MRLLVAAKRLFARQGYDGTSVRQICEEAGANVALVSYYFGGKENMFQALFDTFFPKALIMEFVDRQVDPINGVKELVREVMRFHTTEPELVVLLNQEIALNSPRIDIIRRNAFPIWIKLRELLRQGREDGVFHFRSLDHTMMTVLGNVLFHKQRNYFLPILIGDSNDQEAAIEDSVDFVMRGLQANTDIISQ